MRQNRHQIATLLYTPKTRQSDYFLNFIVLKFRQANPDRHPTKSERIDTLGIVRRENSHCSNIHNFAKRGDAEKLSVRLCSLDVY